MEGGRGRAAVGIDVEGLDKSGVGARQSHWWVRVDAATGTSEKMEFTNRALMRRVDVPARHLRAVNPQFEDYPSAIICRERTVVCNLDNILRCIITADEAFVLLRHGGDKEEYLRKYVLKLEARLQGNSLPFEFIAMEVALEDVCSSFKLQTDKLRKRGDRVVGALTKKLSIPNLERGRKLKIKLFALTMRVQKVKEVIEELMEDDDDMAECCLTEKKKKSMEASLSDKQGQVLEGINVENSKASGREELEMLLEAQLAGIENSLNKLKTLEEYIDDTEDFMNIQLDVLRNQLMKFEVLLGSAAFVVAIFALVPGVFGMNFKGVTLYDMPHAFEKTLGITSIFSLVIFGGFLCYLKSKAFF